ncbi:metabolite transport protein YdfJ [Escherichia coli]|nr:metabolite transport protein YdfJ [Escherichia coli]
MAEMFGCKNRFTRMAISKEIGGLIASGFGPILAGIFCTMTESWYPIAHYDHGIFSDWFNLCAENARGERP